CASLMRTVHAAASLPGHAHDVRELPSAGAMQVDAQTTATAAGAIITPVQPPALMPGAEGRCGAGSSVLEIHDHVRTAVWHGAGAGSRRSLRQRGLPSQPSLYQHSPPTGGARAHRE